MPTDPWPGIPANHYSFNNGTSPSSNLYGNYPSYVSVHVDIPTSMFPAPSMQADLTYAPTAPGPFVKLSPGNTATGQTTRLMLDWADASEAASYAVCYDDAPNGTCTGSWTPTGEVSQAILAGLETNKTYEWQARAINTGGTTDANTNTTWTFTTGSIAYTYSNLLPLVIHPENPPSAFTKLHPGQAATGISTHPTIDWADAAGAFTYEFCYDTTVDGSCTGGWTTTGATSHILLSGLPYSATYEWQARAVNTGGITYANNGTLWSFTTQPGVSTWTVVTGEDFETAIPKDGWSRHDYSND